jgi:proteasome lid subunit RPN8/RPN11
LRISEDSPKFLTSPATEVEGMLSTTSLVLAALMTTPVASCGELCSREAVVLYGNLLAQAQFGRRGTVERAAFVVLRDGALRMIPWRSGGRAHASFRGSIPEDCIAIAHTHPEASMDPSKGDIAVARRLGMPVLVITPAALSVAERDGSTRRIFRSIGWWQRRRR